MSMVIKRSLSIFSISLLGLGLVYPRSVNAQAPTLLFDEAETVAPQITTFQSPAGYILGPGDQVAVTVFGYEEFTGSRVILPDGTIPFPFLGSIQASGKTIDRLSDEIAQGLDAYLINPIVNVGLTVLRPIVVDVAGEVYRPGPVQLSSLTSTETQLNVDSRITAATNTPTLSSALVAAGGIRRTADIRMVTVRRQMSNGEIQTASVNLWEAISTASQGNNLLLRDGDSIFVPKAEENTEIDPTLVATSSIAPDNVRVRVIGEGVVNPGEVEVQPSSSISGAIAAAGGANADASLSNVRIVRLAASGQVEEQPVDLSRLADNYQIQDGDLILVPKKGHLVGIDNVNRTLSPILSPFSGLLGILNIFGLFNNGNR
ncbi:MAG TPA: polysaccharide biosynthesis/export family protein [Nodosilinea sp.]|nr:polysaccharide biosynthesis/export family protein [Nodosilinea sp.]